jgi:hypothetical protein
VVVLHKYHANKEQFDACSKVWCISCEDDLSIANLSRTAKENLVNSGDGQWQCKKLAKLAAKIACTGAETQPDVQDNKTSCGNTTGGSNASSDLHDMPSVLPARREAI